MKVLQTGSRYLIYDDSIQPRDLLPVATYTVGYDQREGCYLQRRPDIRVTEKAYGAHEEKLDKVFASVSSFPRSLGVILSGDKGIGKTLFAKMVCERAVKVGYPVILVEACYKGLRGFLESVEQECVVLFDEFDKMFRYDDDDDKDDQSALLGLFDGTAGGKKLYMVTCNELYSLTRYIVNRPGRFHYHFRFDYPSEGEIADYLRDNVEEGFWNEIDAVVDFSRRVNLNFDCLRAIAYELNGGAKFSDAIRDLNILTTEEEQYSVHLYYDNGRELHNFSYRTNLYAPGVDRTEMYTIRLYDYNGVYITEVTYGKRDVNYDRAKDELLVPADRIRLDYSGAKEEAAKAYKNARPLYLTFRKHPGQSINYLL